NNNANFGKSIVTIRYGPNTVTGWGNRQRNWEAMTGVQRELLPGFTVEASYHRRWYRNFRLTRNVLVVPTDFDPYCVTSPADARLPGGGSQQVCGLFDVNPSKFGQNDNVILPASNFGSQTQMFDGVDLVVNSRLGRGITIQGGTSTGRSKTNRC